MKIEDKADKKERAARPNKEIARLAKEAIEHRMNKGEFEPYSARKFPNGLDVVLIAVLTLLFYIAAKLSVDSC